MIKKSFSTWAAEGFPELLRGMTVSVERPWSWRHPFMSALAWAITRASTLILGYRAFVEHKMIYLGKGKCLSQGPEFDIVPLTDYEGCILYFRFNPAWTQEQRNALVADAACHRGEKYGYGDFLAFLAQAIRSPKALVCSLSDHRWVCSEAVCALVRSIEPDYGKPHEISLILPQQLDRWEEARGWPGLAVTLQA